MDDVGEADVSVHTFDATSEQPVSHAVVEAIAAATGRDPVPRVQVPDAADIALDPLHTAIDPDALDALFEGPADTSGPTTRVSFTYEGHRVAVHGNGRIDVWQLSGPAAAAEREHAD